MTERATVFERTQIGVESTPGVAVAATKHLLGTSIEPEPQVTSQDFRPQGSKYLTIVVDQREWIQSALKGYPSFGDIVYLLSSVVSTPTVTQYMDGITPTGVYRWVFDSNPTAPDNPKTFTIEQGSSVRALRYTNAILHQIGLKFTRTAVDLSGQFLAQQIQDGISLTGSTTDVELVPMLGGGFDVFFDSVSGSLGSTKIGRLFDGNLTLANRFGPVWVVDSAKASFVNTVELPATSNFVMQVEADTAGMAYLSQLRAGTTGFLRIRNIGPTIYSAGVYSGSPLTYSITWDVAAKIKTLGKFGDQQGVYAVEWTLEGVADSGWGKAFHIEVNNMTSAL